MPEVVVRCPLTGRPVPTGVLMEHAAFKSPEDDVRSVAWCRYCFGVHAWSKRTAWLEEVLEDPVDDLSQTRVAAASGQAASLRS